MNGVPWRLPSAGLARRSLLALAAAGAVVPAARGQGSADARYPSRPVRLITPFAPGGSTDITGRLITQRMSVLAGEQFIVENRGGAGGDLAMMAAIASPPDGYTLVMGGDAWQVRGPVLRSQMPYDPDRALTAIARFVITWSVLAVHAGTRARSLAEFADELRARRGAVSYGSAGPGTLSHVLAELFARQIGVEAEHIPYRGSSLALQDLAAGRLQYMCPAAGGLLPVLTGPDVRVLAVTGDRRQPALPDVPTIAEAGMPELDINTWYGAFAPAGTPPAIIARLSGLIGGALEDAEVSRRLDEQGVTPAYLPTAPFGAFIASQKELWRGIAARTGLRL